MTSSVEIGPRPQYARWGAVSLALSWLLLAFASYLVIAVGVNEPFVAFDRWEAFTQLMLAPVVVLLWVVWIARAVRRCVDMGPEPLLALTIVALVFSGYLVLLVAAYSVSYLNDAGNNFRVSSTISAADSDTAPNPSFKRTRQKRRAA